MINPHKKTSIDAPGMFNGKNRLVYAKLKQMIIWFSKGTFLNFFTKHTAFCKKIKPKMFVVYKPFFNS